MAKIIAVANHKGGCGKTTSVINLGAALAEQGHPTLLIDLDPQANLTICLGVQPNTQSNNIYRCLIKEEPAQPIQISTRLALEPATADLVGAELELVNAKGRENRLKNLLEPIKDKYEYILLDCPPSIGLITLNALMAAQYVIIPLQAQYLALQGLAKMQEVIQMARGINNELQLAAVFLTQYDNRKVLHRSVMDTAQQALGKIVCKTVIHDNVALAEAPTTGQTIYQYAPKSKGAADYIALAKEIRSRCKNISNN